MENVKNDMTIGEAQSFEHDVFGTLTVLLRDGDPWFIAKELADKLGYSDTSAMTRKLLPKHRGIVLASILSKEIEKLKEAQRSGAVVTAVRSEASNLRRDPSLEATLISESGFYMSIMRSKRKEALAFQEWVTEEVLPSIRKHGAYATKETLESWEADPELRDAEFKKMKEEKELLEKERIAGRMRENDMQLKITRQELALKNTSWKAGKFDSSNNTKGLYTISNIASTIGTSAQHVNGFLRHYGFQYKQGQRWHLYDQYKGKGWTQDVKRLEFKGVTMCWTYTGREMIFDLWDMYQPVIKGRPWEAVKR